MDNAFISGVPVGMRVAVNAFVLLCKSHDFARCHRRRARLRSALEERLTTYASRSGVNRHKKRMSREGHFRLLILCFLALGTRNGL